MWAEMMRRFVLQRRRTREALEGFAFISPWLLGFVIWTAGPMIASLVISLMEWELLTPPQWIGFSNYQRLFSDKLLVKSLWNTFYYVAFSVPLRLAVALVMALAMNLPLWGIRFYRVAYYIPSITPMVANAILWLWIFNPDFGLANAVLDYLGLPTQLWIFEPKLVKLCFIIMTLWGFGQAMMIFLAGLQGVPQVLYEAAEIDGATSATKFWRITLPILSPVIFFNLIIGIIGAFQVFSSALIMTDGGPSNASLFYVLYLYRNAFQYFRMGYASAMAWVLFAIVVSFTLIQIRLSSMWVYYEAEIV
jgi:multiple sugar transport system permease protein